MAATRVHATPAEQLFKLAGQARREGLTFDEFWIRACRFESKPIVRTNSPAHPHGSVQWPSDKRECRSWQDAIREIEGGWRRAYENLPPSEPEAALVYLDRRGIAFRGDDLAAAAAVA